MNDENTETQSDESPKEETKPQEKALESLPELVERLEKANQEAKEILARNEELVARNLIGGKSMAGEQADIAKKEESPQEYAKRILGGR